MYDHLIYIHFRLDLNNDNLIKQESIILRQRYLGKPRWRHIETYRLCNYQQKAQETSFTLQNLPMCRIQERRSSFSVLHQIKTTTTKNQPIT